MHQTQFSQKIPQGGFSQIRSHIYSHMSGNPMQACLLCIMCIYSRECSVRGMACTSHIIGDI